ncbi:low temperature requirement protein A [Pseudoclavibacter sp. JSM 162008]|uniref:low temperature requirement protein A n=1 Tax=Pseudoclavibacter sp. JSM 162008 TaxID=3229855 RepID=UPI003523E839
MIAGYVVMRVALVCQWLRAARSGSRYRTTAMTYAVFVSVAQILWIVIAILPLTLVFALLGGLVALLVEIAGPLVVVGMVLIFGMWWVYFMVPAAEVLHVHRERSFPWGYGHFFIFASIAATGAGLHIVAYTFDEHYHVSDVTAVLAVAIPVLIYLLTVFTLYSYLLRTINAFHALLALASVAVLAASVVMAANGASVSVSLLVGMLAPVVVVIGYESVGHRHAAAHLDRIEQDAPAPH